jgi:hypothetical protein
MMIHYHDKRTRSFARVLGPFLTILAVVVVLRASEMPAILDEFTASSVWPFVTGAFILVGGIAIVAFHQLWRGVAAVIVSVLGWLLAIRGVLLLAFPTLVDSLADRLIGAVGLWSGMCMVLALIGIYLTYVGWQPTHAGQAEVHISVDFPHAA